MFLMLLSVQLCVNNVDSQTTYDMGSVEISNQISIVSVRLMMTKYMELNAGNCRYDMRVRGTTGMKL